MKHLRFIFSVLLMGLGSASFSQTEEQPPSLKILTYNIYHGETMNHDFNLDRIAKVIKESGADLVALQEVDFKTNRAQGYDLVTELAWRCQMQGIFGKAMDYDGGEYGEGILSKYSFLNSQNHALPYSQNHEPRAALEVSMVLKSGDTISFIGTHLDHLKEDTDRIKQAHEINRIFSKTDYPIIMAGDLNDIPGSRSIEILESFWTPSYPSSSPSATYPSIQADKKIDYIMYAPANRWKVIETSVICDSIASDHCAYLVTLELQK